MYYYLRAVMAQSDCSGEETKCGLKSWSWWSGASCQRGWPGRVCVWCERGQLHIFRLWGCTAPREMGGCSLLPSPQSGWHAAVWPCHWPWLQQSSVEEDMMDSVTATCKFPIISTGWWNSMEVTGVTEDDGGERGWSFLKSTIIHKLLRALNFRLSTLHHDIKRSISLL